MPHLILHRPTSQYAQYFRRLKCLTVQLHKGDGTMCMFGEVLTSVLFCSVHQLYAIKPVSMEVLAPSQTPALVLLGGMGLHAMKVCGIFIRVHLHLHTCTKGNHPRKHFLSLFIIPQHHSHSHFPSDFYMPYYNALPCNCLACRIHSQCPCYKHTITIATHTYLLYCLNAIVWASMAH